MAGGVIVPVTSSVVVVAEPNVSATAMSLTLNNRVTPVPLTNSSSFTSSGVIRIVPPIVMSSRPNTCWNSATIGGDPDPIVVPLRTSWPPEIAPVRLFCKAWSCGSSGIGSSLRTSRDRPRCR